MSSDDIARMRAMTKRMKELMAEDVRNVEKLGGVTVLGPHFASVTIQTIQKHDNLSPEYYLPDVQIELVTNYLFEDKKVGLELIERRLHTLLEKKQVRGIRLNEKMLYALEKLNEVFEEC